MHSFFRLACAVALALAVSACVKSARPLFSTADAVSPLPDQTVLVHGDSVQAYKRQGSEYLRVAGSAGYAKAIFVPIAGERNLYILQVLSDKNENFYALAEHGGGKLEIYTFEAGKLARQLGIPGIVVESDETIRAENANGLRRFFAAAAARRAQAKSTAYQIYDLRDPAQLRLAEKEFTAFEQRQKEKQKEKQKEAKAAASAAPAQAGAWSLRDEVDPITDARRTFVVGAPASYEGVQDKPFLRVSCGQSGVGMTIYWGAVLSDMYPSGEADFVEVAVRFDQHPAQYLGWQPSDDWSRTFPPNDLAGGMAQIGQGLLNTILPSTRKVAMMWDPKIFHSNMRNSSKVVLRASTRSGTAATLIFDMNGYREVTAAFPSRCN